MRHNKKGVKIMYVNIVTQWCKISSDDVQKLLKYFAKQPLEIQIQILKSHREVLFRGKDQMKQQSIAIEVASYIALILAVKYHYALERKLTSAKFEELSIDELKNVTMLKIKKHDAKYATKTKRDKLIHYWSVVKQLKKENRSFRYIALYLRNEHSFSISHSEIHKAWNKIEDYEYIQTKQSYKE
ncbi:hypothetical protein [Sulfurimonas hydrogeniphila]|uniref:hypothetical protein n=1 Tax=Sulfurimonas hydrogeniphila TaxID=2509341 RepID=UPI00125EE894|nr:hypothetical protein [Sulfurimonas hydrogeniphila]